MKYIMVMSILLISCGIMVDVLAINEELMHLNVLFGNNNDDGNDKNNLDDKNDKFPILNDANEEPDNNEGSEEECVDMDQYMVAYQIDNEMTWNYFLEAWALFQDQIHGRN